MTHRIHSPQIIESLRQFDSPTVSNAIEHFEVRDPVAGYASMELCCQFPRREPMVGYAVTCTADSTTPGDRRQLNLEKLVDALQTAPKPGVLVIKHIGHNRLRSCFVGDMFCTWVQKLDGVGIVTDGGARDRAGIDQQAPGVQLFAPGWVVSHGHGTFIDFNLTVSICGLTIRPGDLLHGDENGLLTVPHEIAESVLQKAQEIREVEAEFFEFMDSKTFSIDEMKRRL